MAGAGGRPIATFRHFDLSQTPTNTRLMTDFDKNRSRGEMPDQSVISSPDLDTQPSLVGPSVVFRGFGRKSFEELGLRRIEIAEGRYGLKLSLAPEKL